MGKRFSTRKRAEILRRLEGSGLNAAEFCRRRGLCYGTVVRWRREADVLANGLGGGDGRESPPAFVEVELNENNQNPDMRTPENSAMLYAELALPGGAMLRIYGNGRSGHDT